MWQRYLKLLSEEGQGYKLSSSQQVFRRKNGNQKCYGFFSVPFNSNMRYKFDFERTNFFVLQTRMVGFVVRIDKGGHFLEGTVVLRGRGIFGFINTVDKVVWPP